MPSLRNPPSAALAPSTMTKAGSSSNTDDSRLPAIIIDAGAHELKIGFSHLPSHSSPIQVSPNLLAKSRSSSSKGTMTYIGSSLLTDCHDFGSLSLRLPMERGFVTDWAAQKIVWDHALIKALACPEARQASSLNQAEGENQPKAKNKGKASATSAKLLEGRTVIITETYFNLPELEVAFDTLIFEEYGAEALWRLTPAQLVPYAPIFGRPSSPKVPEDVGGSSPSSMAASKRKTGAKASQVDSRPEAVLVVDIGHSAVNVIPVHGDDAIWSAAKRLDVSGRLLTNLLKETVSFRQWDMMDEVWLMGKVKEACTFVAAKSGRRALSFVGHGTAKEEEAGGRGFLKDMRNPKDADFATLVEVMRQAGSTRRNPLAQEYVLPDYSSSSSSSTKTIRSEEAGRRFGFVRSGAASQEAGRYLGQLRAKGREEEAQVEYDEEDVYVADLLKWEALRRKVRRGEGGDMEESDDDDDDDDDEEEEDSEDDFVDAVEGRVFKKRKAPKKGGAAAGGKRKRKGEEDDDDDDDDDDAQLLSLGPERFQVPEVLFCPAAIGLQQAPLHEIIAECIGRCDEGWRDVLWGNVVLVGGGARLKGLKRRLENELRALAPEDVPLNVLLPESPELAAVRGGISLASSSPQSAQGKLLRSRLVTRAEWSRGRGGGSSSSSFSSTLAAGVGVGGQPTLAGTELCRSRFATWSGLAREWMIEEDKRKREERERERRLALAAEREESGEEESSEEESESESESEKE